MTMHETSKRVRRRRNHAFNVMEIIVVLGLIGVITAYGAPALMYELHRQTTRGVVREVHTLMQQARIAAIKSSRPVILAYSMEPLTGPVTPWNPSGVGRTHFFILAQQEDGSLRQVRSVTLAKGFFMRGPASSDVVGDANSSTFTGTLRDDDFNEDGNIEAFEKLTLTARFLPNGTVSQLGALRISDSRSKQNTFEVAVADLSGRAELRKHLCEKSKPSIILEEFHPEPDVKSKYRWVWY